MAVKKCDNYEICEQYGIYGLCKKDIKGNLDFLITCEPYQKQIITILASIDEKLSKLLEKNDVPDKADH